METGDSIDKTGVRPRYEQNYSRGNFGDIVRTYKMLKDKTVEESTEIIIEMKVIAEVEMGTGLEKDHFLEALVMIGTIGVQTTVSPGQGQGQAQIWTG